MNALMLASQRGHADMVKLLIQVGAAMDEQTMQGSTALMLACKRGHEKCVEVESIIFFFNIGVHNIYTYFAGSRCYGCGDIHARQAWPYGEGYCHEKKPFPPTHLSRYTGWLLGDSRIFPQSIFVLVFFLNVYYFLWLNF